MTPEKVFRWIQVLTLAITLAVGVTLIIVFMLGSAAATKRTQDSDRLRFEMIKAQTCALVGVISLPVEDRSSDAVQTVVDACLAQVDLTKSEATVFIPVATTGEE